MPHAEAHAYNAIQDKEEYNHGTRYTIGEVFVSNTRVMAAVWSFFFAAFKAQPIDHGIICFCIQYWYEDCVSEA